MVVLWFLGWGLSRLDTRGYNTGHSTPHRGPKYADQAVTGRLNSPRQNQSINLISICHSDRFLFLCIRIEMINIAAAAIEIRIGVSRKKATNKLFIIANKINFTEVIF